MHARVSENEYAEHEILFSYQVSTMTRAGTETSGTRMRSLALSKTCSYVVSQYIILNQDRKGDGFIRTAAGYGGGVSSLPVSSKAVV